LFGISLKIEGMEQAFADLDRFMSKVDKPFLDRQLVTDLQREFFKAEKKQFATEGGFGSAGWPKLSPEYRKWKRKHYPGKKILELKGRLKRSLTTSMGDSILQVERSGRRLTMGSTDPKAKYHQHGTSKMPKRPPIDTPKEQNVAYHKIVQRRIVVMASQTMGTTWEVRRDVA